jgi:ketosteroid isomerase-like protein
MGAPFFKEFLTMRLPLFPLILLSTLAAACSPATSTADDEAAVAAAVKEFQTAMDTGDAATVMRYIADDALMMEGGTIENRMQYETDHLPLDLDFAKGMTAKRMPVKQDVRGDVAWVRTSTEFSGTFQEQPLSLLGLETMVLTREPEGWRIRALHWSAQRRPN